jgi:hypothetical protein
MTYIIETFIFIDGALKSVSKSITDDLEWGLEAEVEAHYLGKLVQRSKGPRESILLFEHGRIEYKTK